MIGGHKVPFPLSTTVHVLREVNRQPRVTVLLDWVSIRVDTTLSHLGEN